MIRTLDAVVYTGPEPEWESNRPTWKRMQDEPAFRKVIRDVAWVWHENGRITYCMIERGFIRSRANSFKAMYEQLFKGGMTI